ncbi:hypothetical protein [Brevibacterium sp. UCMA 11752]|uniref:hypothetical protein n=1 Tax=Brevibacterium sp. UCMA 11752 TaxID=2745946 RepID=UPI001F454A1A|nr:hypothetical protein [Brevibacterium sp. UCMA 11752]MCF2586823.1 hypothetical protein [Brevibacterium sp. UCMA 11752]
MKKLILAPAVALAFTGLVAAPVAAAEAPSTQSASAKAEQVKKEKAEKLAEEKAEQKKADEEKAAAEKEAKEKAAKAKAEQEKKDAAEKKAADKKDAAKKAADKKKADDKADEESGDDAKDPKKPAPKDDDSKDSKKDDSDAKDDAEKINASLKVSNSSITAEDLATKGVKVTVTGLEKGDKLSTSGLTAPATTASADGSKSLTLDYSGDAEDLKEGKKSFTIKVQRAGVPATTLSGSTEVIEAQDAIDSELTVDPDEVTPEDLADPDKGVQVTVSNAEKGDTVTDSLTEEGRTVDADGNFTFGVYYQGDPEELDEGPVPFTVEINREGEEAVTLKGEIEVVDEVSDADPKVSLSTDEITVSDFKNDGLKFTGEGFTPGGTVSVRGEAVSTQRAAAQADKATADEDGNVSGVVTAPESIEAGKYSLTFIDDTTSEESAPVEVTVTEDDDAVDPIEASLKVDPKEITAADLANKEKGVTVTVSGVKKGDKITDSLTGDTETADADGDYKLHLYYQGNPDNLEEGKVPFTVTIDREGTESETLKGNINVVAEDKGDGDDGDNGDGGDTPEAPAEASFTVSPKMLEAADFANEEKGVTLAVEDCEPGSDVHFAVTPKGIPVTAYENTVKADDEGKASVNVFGTSDNISAYVGAYTASAICGDDSMKESFTVTAGADGGGSDGSDNGGNDGSQLPRTGIDLGGLASGALLLIIGGAAIAVTGRRKKIGQSPTDF